MTQERVMRVTTNPLIRNYVTFHINGTLEFNVFLQSTQTHAKLKSIVISKLLCERRFKLMRPIVEKKLCVRVA